MECVNPTETVDDGPGGEKGLNSFIYKLRLMVSDSDVQHVKFQRVKKQEDDNLAYTSTFSESSHYIYGFGLKKTIVFTSSSFILCEVLNYVINNLLVCDK